MPVENVPAAEFEITVELVDDLLRVQHPDLAGRPLRLVANGWDNAIVRIGDDLVARMPRRQLGADLVANEQQWLPQLAPLLPIPIAAPVRFGRPASGYPWRWSICRWFDGEVAADTVLASPADEARRLGDFLAALHRAAPRDAPANPYRGQPIDELVPRMRANLDRLGDAIDRRAVNSAIDGLDGVASWEGPEVWLHGDLHTANVLVADGALVAVLDFGDLTAGDPAVDLAIAWMLFGAAERRVLRDAAGALLAIDDATWARARGWALHFAMLYLLHSADSDRFRRMGRQLLGAVLADR